MKMRFAALVSLPWALACATRDIALATAGGGDDGGAPATTTSDAGGTSCTSNDDCLANAFCEKNGCNAPEGTCIERPLICDSSSAPVCGCDNVNYWNDCLRQQVGVSGQSESQGPCPQSAPCQGPTGSGCPGAGASCAQVASSLQGPGAPVGTCWVLPNACPTGPGVTTSAQPPCQSLCDAIQSGVPFLQPGPGTSCTP
jgi:hypothetical protein